MNNAPDITIENKIRNFLRTGFEPAMSLRDAEYMYTTEDVRFMISKHVMEDIPGSLIHDILIQEGFIYNTTNTKTTWLLKKF